MGFLIFFAGLIKLMQIRMHTNKYKYNTHTNRYTRVRTGSFVSNFIQANCIHANTIYTKKYTNKYMYRYLYKYKSKTHTNTNARVRSFVRNFCQANRTHASIGGK